MLLVPKNNNLGCVHTLTALMLGEGNILHSTKEGIDF